MVCCEDPFLWTSQDRTLRSTTCLVRLTRETCKSIYRRRFSRVQSLEQTPKWYWWMRVSEESGLAWVAPFAWALIYRTTMGMERRANSESRLSGEHRDVTMVVLTMSFRGRVADRLLGNGKRRRSDCCKSHSELYTLRDRISSRNVPRSLASLVHTVPPTTSTKVKGLPRTYGRSH